MKVLLISANTTKIPYPVSPLGLDYVLAAVSIHHEVKITDMVEHRDLESLGELVRNFSPDLIGISFRNIDNLDTLEPAGFIEHYRQLTGAVRFTSQAPIVLGGSGFTIFPQELLNALGADFGIVGEGERFGLLVDALERNEDPMRIPGVVTPKSPVVLPEPWTGPFSRIIEAGSPYFRYYLERGGMLGLQTKRGCPFECLYCTYPSIEGKSVRVAPPHRVAEEARLLQDCGAKYLYITDSVFNADYAHSLEIAKAFVRARISIPWGGFFTPTNHPPDYYKRLAEAGLTHVEFGAESLSDSVLAN